jgi:chemotaxis protein MotD
VFSVTPEPTVSHSTPGPRPAPARAEPSAPDGFAALLDGNTGTERPPSPAPDASSKRTSGESRSRSDAAPAPRSASPSATDTAPDAAGKPADAAATTNPAADAPSATPQIGALADATTITPDDDASSEDAAPTADDNIAALETAIPVVVIPLMAATDEPAPAAGEDAAGSAGTGGSAGRMAAPLPADVALPRTDAAETALAGLPADADAPAPRDAATGPAPASGKTKAKAAPVTVDAGARTETRADAAAPASDQLAETDTAPHGAQHAEAKHGEARQATDAAPDTDKPAIRPAADHRAPVTTAASHDAAIDPAQQTPSQTAQPLHVQASSAGPAAAPAPQLNVMAASTMAVPLNGLAMDIALRAAGGSSRFEIRLDPAELGRIDVRLDVDKHGNVTSHLTVERPATLDMLRNDAPRLQQALEDAGLKTGEGGLQFSLRDQSSSGRQDDGSSGRPSQRLVIAEDDVVPPQIAGRSYGRMLGASGGVDIRV